MHTGEMIHEIGRLRGTVTALEGAMVREIAALRREVMGHIMLLHRQRPSGGHKPRRLWMHVAAIGFTVLGSLLGLLKPATAAAIIVAVWRAVMH